MIDRVIELLENITWTDIVDAVLIFLFVLTILLVISKLVSNRLAYFTGLLIILIAAAVFASGYIPVFYKILPYIITLIIVVYVVSISVEIRRGLIRLFVVKKKTSDNIAYQELPEEDLRKSLGEIVRSVQNMSKSNVGALLVFPSGRVPAHILESGTMLNAEVSSSLIESIFNTGAPLHDGAVFVFNNRIVSAGCFLPLSQDNTLPKDLGTRHRAAIGITETINCLTIICSEETGIVSSAKNGVLQRYYDSQMLTAELEKFYGLKTTDAVKRRRK